MKRSVALTARIEDCVQLTYRTPADSVLGLVPEGLELVTRGPWAFWNVMACRIKRLRPCGMPGVFGVSYSQVLYQLHAQAMNKRAEVVRGLATIRCDVDASAAMKIGQRITSGRLNMSTIKTSADDCRVIYHVTASADHASALELDLAHAPASLLAGSCFPTAEDARQFSRRGSSLLAVNEQGGRRLLRVTRVEREENMLSETPLAVRESRLGYFETIGQTQHIQLEWACRLNAMDSCWRNEKMSELLPQARVVNELLASTC